MITRDFYCDKCGKITRINVQRCGHCDPTVTPEFLKAADIEAITPISIGANPLPPNPVAGCEVKSWIRNIDQLPDTLIFRGFQIDIYADMKDGRNELTKYLKALLERGNDA